MWDFFIPILGWLFKAFGFFGILILALKLGLSTFLSKFIEFRIELEKDKNLEDYKTAEYKRQKAAMIANLISVWLSEDYNRDKLNQLSFEAFLWLPKDITTELSKLLVHDKNSKHYKEILCAVRILLLGNEEAINPADIIHFDPIN